jgi:hypothetical protein
MVNEGEAERIGDGEEEEMSEAKLYGLHRGGSLIIIDKTQSGLMSEWKNRAGHSLLP